MSMAPTPLVGIEGRVVSPKALEQSADLLFGRSVTHGGVASEWLHARGRHPFIQSMRVEIVLG